ncbi:hypothetical protein CDG81_02645 [Actinopolyspora erythraea]|uniref:Uncharacterized protein n=1 Tax=Actinopolyspora erythraea TaxID=414996 RepID=A0A099D251_9ACTN|nr:hypothetical protein [Actinopolyspora erythraea]ASU77384.1 hypothetical protein CDG81_02645 [Actinopolyspora erythraea]KGI80109.1 hypothetical protein IL38_18330 [Actinopolyspora erythraea]
MATPREDVVKAKGLLEEREHVPEGTTMELHALLSCVREIVLTEETVQPWRDVVSLAEQLDTSSAAGVLGLMGAIEEAPTTPLPPRGWLRVDLARTDFARAVNRAVEPVEAA